MRLLLALSLLAVAACRYDASGVLHVDDDGLTDASTAPGDANLAEVPDGGFSVIADATPPPDAIPPPPDAIPPEACGENDNGGDDCRDDDCPRCDSISVCCADGHCAPIGLCF